MAYKKALTLSIVIPAYNEERYLKKCLQSIMRQEYPVHQIIVVNNNSSDSTEHIAKSFAGVTVVGEPRQGIVYARNAGFDACKGDLICRIDADCILPNSWSADIARHYDQLQRPAYVAVTCPSYFTQNSTGFFWYWLHRLLFFWATRVATGAHTLSGSNMYMTRKLWARVRDDVCERTDIHEDMDLAIHCHLQGAQPIFTTSFKNTMVGRNVLHKAMYYSLMWWKALLVRHRSLAEESSERYIA